MARAWLLSLMALSPAAFAQTSQGQSIDASLTASHREMLAANSPERRELLSLEFEKQLSEQLAQPDIFHHTLPNLQRYLTIRSSRDKRVKFYSWEDRTGGTWHSWKAFAQFSTDGGKVVVQRLHSGAEAQLGGYSDSGIYEVHEIMLEGTKHYLTFASGTHGGGQQHAIVRLFKIEGDKLEKCRCFTGRSGSAESHDRADSELVMEYPRSQRLALVFHPLPGEIVFNEFKYDPDSGRGRPTGKIVTLRWNSGKFRE